MSNEGAVKVSENFRVREFKCHDGSDAIFIADELLEVLQTTRTELNSPVYINSAYRTQSHNASVGGAKKSMHLYGCAADIRVEGYNSTEVFNYLDAKYNDRYGIIRYSGYVHIDVRPNKYREI